MLSNATKSKKIILINNILRIIGMFTNQLQFLPEST